MARPIKKDKKEQNFFLPRKVCLQILLLDLSHNFDFGDEHQKRTFYNLEKMIKNLDYNQLKEYICDTFHEEE